MTITDKTTARKWQARDIGPRQLKLAQKAVNALSWEARTFIEVTGVIGGAEHRTTLTSPFGPERNEALMEAGRAIGDRYDWTVTGKTYQDVMKDIAAAIAVAAADRPVHDRRITADEDAANRAVVAERQAKWDAEKADSDALWGEVRAKAPAWAKAAIIAELHEDESDSMTDYFSNKTVRAVAIGYRSGSREDFKQLHRAAAAFPATAHLRFEERRDNYSMGKGNYISDHGWDGSGSGWVVKSCPLGVVGWYPRLTEVALPDAAPAAEATATTTAGGVTIRPSSIGREGVVEVVFAAKPSDEVRASMHAHGFRWARSNACWYGRDKAFAESLLR